MAAHLICVVLGGMLRLGYSLTLGQTSFLHQQGEEDIIKTQVMNSQNIMFSEEDIIKTQVLNSQNIMFSLNTCFPYLKHFKHKTFSQKNGILIYP